MRRPAFPLFRFRHSNTSSPHTTSPSILKRCNDQRRSKLLALQGQPIHQYSKSIRVTEIGNTDVASFAEYCTGRWIGRDMWLEVNLIALRSTLEDRSHQKTYVRARYSSVRAGISKGALSPPKPAGQGREGPNQLHVVMPLLTSNPLRMGEPSIRRRCRSS